MKIQKNAFTLAEVLITIGILGLIAAMTIPAINTNVSATQLAVSLKTAQASISDKIQAGMAIEDVNNVRDLKAFDSDDKTGIYKGLSKYLRLDAVSESHTIYRLDDGSEVKTWSASDIRQTNTKAFIYLDDITETRAGSVSSVKQSGGQVLIRAAIVYLDVNGFTKPNRLGYDVYKYYLAQDGRLYPVGGADVSLFETSGASDTTKSWEGSDSDYSCDRSSSAGYGCAGRIADENWQITYLKKIKTASSDSSEGSGSSESSEN